MFIFKETVMLIVATASLVHTAPANETRTLPSVNTLSSLAQSFFLQPPSGRPSAFNGELFAQQSPFQLLSGPQFGNALALFNNITQSLNKPQLGQYGIEGDDVSGTPAQSRVLHPPSNPSLNNIYSTLPFNELNLTEFSWLWEDLLVNGSSSGSNSNNLERMRSMRPQPKVFGGGGNTTYADLNFLTVPQLINLFGR